MTVQYRIFPNGENSLVIDFGNRIDARVNDIVIKLADHLNQYGFIDYTESVPAYSSLGVFYEIAVVKNVYPQYETAFEAVSQIIEDALSKFTNSSKQTTRMIEIPVCYDAEFAPDLEFVAQNSGLAKEQVIETHSGGIYRVFMIGFLPGFAYMGELDARIATPRRQTPRTVVEQGSVGIAGSQTGIYPLNSPGGWQIIGKTPFKLFKPDDNEISLLTAGDRVKFLRITKKEFTALSQ